MEVIVFPFLIIVAILSLYRGIQDVIRENKYRPKYEYPEYKVPTRWQFPFKIVWSFDYCDYFDNELLNNPALDPFDIWVD